MMKPRAVVFALSALLAGQACAEDLLDIYRLAKEQDSELRAAKADLMAALQAKPLAESNLRPQVGLGADAGMNRSQIFDPAIRKGTQYYTNAGLSLSLSHPLYHKDYWLQLEQADSSVAQAEAGYTAQEQGLIMRVARAYFEVLAAKDNVVFASAENRALARQLEQAKQRFEVGLTAVTSVHEAQAAYDQSNAGVIKAENMVEDKTEALREIVRDMPETLASLQAKIPMDPPQPPKIEAWADKAQQDSLTIRVARYAAEVAQKEVEVQKAGDSPTVDVVASHSLFYQSKDALADGQDTQVGLQLRMPLYTGGRVDAATNQALFQFEAAQERLDGERRLVNRNVRDAYRGVESGISRVQALEAAIVSTRSALEATQAGYDVGTRTMVDVLNAESDLRQALTNHALARYEFILSGLQLKQAAGDLSEADLIRVNGWLQTEKEAEKKAKKGGKK